MAPATSAASSPTPISSDDLRLRRKCTPVKYRPSAAVLAYGAQARQGSLVCASTEAGISCSRDGTNNGFTISRQTYSVH